MGDAFSVKLAQFEGPLDLLLHLIKVDEIDIFTVDLLVLARQYFAFLRLVEFRDLAEAGEFLQIAAALLEIKSRRLLPREKPPAHEFAGLLTDSDDPQVEFRQRLLIYHAIKCAAETLETWYLRRYSYPNAEWERLCTLPQFQEKELPRRDRWVLPVLYEQLLVGVTERRAPIPDTKLQKIKIETVMTAIMDKLQLTEFTAFQEFFPSIESRFALVVYFIAVLELVKRGEIRIHQEDSKGAIWVYLPSYQGDPVV